MDTLMTCEIKWIDDKGTPTGDSNPAIGRVRMREHQYFKGRPQGRPMTLERSRWYRICAVHYKRLSDPNMSLWEFSPQPCAGLDPRSYIGPDGELRHLDKV